MSRRADQQYLLSEQYRDAEKLKARMNLHARFKTNPYDWFHFVFDHFNFPNDAKVLELGCGPGTLWEKNCERIPPNWSITLSDFSPGMLAEARNNLSLSPHSFEFKIIDAQNLPIEDEWLDAVIANHMLYHVPDRIKAFSEIHRVLKLGGVLFAATNGEKHLSEMHAYYKILKPELSFPIDHPFSSGTFTLENGPEQLSPWFQTEVNHYEDSLVIPETEPLIAYLLSMISVNADQISQERVTILREEIDAQIRKQGSIYISKSTGLLVSRKKNSSN